jgi:hypothetical protein
MTRYAGPTTEILLRRVREEGGVAVDPTDAIKMLSRCQRIINAGAKRVTASGTLTTFKQQLLYPYRDQLTDAVDIISVKEGNRTLHRFEALHELDAYDKTWFRKTSSQFDFWMQLGRDLLIIYPAKTSDSSVTVIYSKLTTEYDDFDEDYNTALDLPDEDVDAALGLAEVSLLLRSRALKAAQERMKELLEDLAFLVGEQS